jgi:hypothetical protein
LHSFGAPCVAQRVWAIPDVPLTGSAVTTLSSIAIFPTAFRVSTPFPFITATPAESYPRYSSRFNPSMRTGVATRGPMYPTIPHMSVAPFC